MDKWVSFFMSVSDCTFWEIGTEYLKFKTVSGFWEAWYSDKHQTQKHSSRKCVLDREHLLIFWRGSHPGVQRTYQAARI